MTDQITDEYHTPVEATRETCCVDLGRKCEATTCMGWRWGPPRKGKILHRLPNRDEDNQLLQHPRARLDTPKELKLLPWVLKYDEENKKHAEYLVYEQISQGYCGRAGNPDPVIEINT